MKADKAAGLTGIFGQETYVHLVGNHVIMKTAHPALGNFFFGDGNMLFYLLPGPAIDDIHRLPDRAGNQLLLPLRIRNITDRVQFAGNALFSVAFLSVVALGLHSERHAHQKFIGIERNIGFFTAVIGDMMVT